MRLVWINVSLDSKPGDVSPGFESAGGAQRGQPGWSRVRMCAVAAVPPPVSTSEHQKPSETTSRSREDKAKMKAVLNWMNHTGVSVTGRVSDLD